MCCKINFSLCTHTELEKKLRARADREALVQKNILPGMCGIPTRYTVTLFRVEYDDETETQNVLRQRREHISVCHATWKIEDDSIIVHCSSLVNFSRRK
jgi:hypothetical protein